MAGIQCKLSDDIDAHKYGSSISNQRIENFWSHLKRIYLSWVINFFKDLVIAGSLVLGNVVHMECLWFVFSPLIQCELDRLTEEWNAHKIRKSNHSLVSGIPDVLYLFPEHQGYEQCGKNVMMAEVNEILNDTNVYLDSQNIQKTSEPDLEGYFRYVVRTSNTFYPPATWEKAKQMYECIIESAI